MKKCILTFITAVFISSLTMAGGFQVSLHSAQNVGMGLVGTSLSSSPSCIFYNPGALAMVPGIVNVSGGVNLFMVKTKFRNDSLDYSTTNKFGINFPFYFYASVKFLKRFAFGIGAYTPYGSATVYDNDWYGRYVIQKAKLTAIYIQPTVSVNLFDKVGIGAGLVYAIGMLEQDIALDFKLFGQPDGQVCVEKNIYNAFGFNVGILVKPIDRLSIGISYRSKVNMKFDLGDVTFNNIPVFLANMFPAGEKFSTEIPLPANLNFGVHFNITKDWLINAQFDYTFWKVYDTTFIDFDSNTVILQDQKVTNKYTNSWAVRLGTSYDYKIFTFRLGGYYDNTCIQEDQVHPQDPGNSHYGITGGLSIRPINNLSIDIGYLYLHSFERDTKFYPSGLPANSYPNKCLKGNYVSDGHTAIIGVSFKF